MTVQRVHLVSIINNLKQSPDIWYCSESEYRIIGPEYISIGNNFICGKHARLEAIDDSDRLGHFPNLQIGENFSMEDFCHIGCINEIVIGNGVLLGSKVFITDHFHGDISKKDLNMRPALRPLSSRPVRIGNNVWVGDNVSIMPGVCLGDNCIVGANAVVTHSYPEGSVIAGCPAKLIKNICD